MTSLLRRLSVLLLVLFLFPGMAEGQSRIGGVVLDAGTGAPLPSANVFIDGRARGTSSNSAGRFTLSGLSPGTYKVVASMVGYKPQVATITLDPPSETSDPPPRIRFELPPQPVELGGVTVKDSRDEWLERLDRFRDAFFGTAPNADSCSFVNPEVLSFEENGSSLIARTEEPLRVRNKALGYELTYHLSKYVVAPDRRIRLGPVEFDTLEAQSPKQRAAWEDARYEAYTGSYDHFIDALRSGALDEEGFQVRVASPSQYAGRFSRKTRPPIAPPQDPSTPVVRDASEIYQPADVAGLAILSMPDNSDSSTHLEVRYMREKEHPQFYEQYRTGRSRLPYQRSWIRFVRDTKALINAETGDSKRREGLGYIIERGHWGWYETAATSLPASYRPPDSETVGREAS